VTRGIFADRDDFVDHLNTALFFSQARADEYFADFEDFGYIARQENTGLSVSPKLWGGNLAGALTEVSADAVGRVQVVMLSHPILTDDEYDHWVEVVQGWASGLPDQTRGAYAREIKLMKHVQDGIPLNVLHKEMPSNLLLSYRRPGDFVIVIDPPSPDKRKIFTAKNIG
jgi:hypothetical protein